jgi:hypothetical protein
MALSGVKLIIKIVSDPRRNQMDNQRRAIKTILSQSTGLRRRVLPFLTIKDGQLYEIEFDRCMEQNLSPELRAVIIWAQALWTGHSNQDLMSLASAIDQKMLATILKALKILWLDK